MPRAIRQLAVTLTAFALLAQTAPASERGRAAADEVSLASYQDYLENWLYTHSGDDRGFGPEHNLARTNIHTLFADFGLTVELEPFPYSSTTYYNVVATKLGTTHPDQMYIVGAHFDSVSNPGADDDASGVALLLETARILSQYDSQYTIRFVAFDREEQGLYGSYAYVDDHTGDDILGMIQADMVAYDPGTDNALLYADTNGQTLKNDLGLAMTLYAGGLTYTDGGWISASDHAPFADAGYPACLLIEGEVWTNPYYHTQQDNVDNPSNINYAYALKMTRSVVGYLVDHADVDVPVNTLDFVFPEGQPDLVSPAGGTRLRVEVVGLGDTVPQPGTGTLTYDIGAGWQTVPMQVIAPNVYEAAFPAAACGTRVYYYLGAEDTAAQPYTDPPDAPLLDYSATSATDRVALLDEPLDADPGWTTEGDWDFGQPTGGGGQYGGPDPTSGYTGSYVYGYNLDGDYPNSMPQYYLTAPPIDCSGRLGVQLSLWRWLGVEGPDYDHARIRVSTDGTNWTNVWANTSTIADTEWTPMDIDISAIADDQPTVYIRWTMGTTDSGWRYCGWNIDDIRVTALRCEPECIADIDGDLTVDLTDLGILLAHYNQSPADPNQGDIDGNNQVDLTDLGLLLANYGQTCD